MKAGAKGNTKKVDERSLPSIFSRPFDLLLCFVFLVKAIIAAYSDIMNAIGNDERVIFSLQQRLDPPSFSVQFLLIYL